MKNLAYSRGCLALVLAAGCPGTNVDELPDDAALDDGASGDATVDPTPKLSGKTVDYFTPAEVLDDVVVTSDGLDPPVTATSAGGGLYELTIPVGSTFYVGATRNLYRPTRSAAITVADESVTGDIFLITTADVARQYATTNNTLIAGRGFLAAELQLEDGTPRIGVPLADITLVDAANVPVPGVKGPYVFGALGDVDPELTVSTAFGNRARIAFLDVPQGTFKLSVAYLDGDDPATVTTPVTFTPDGATIAVSRPGALAGGPAAIENPTFTTHIHPRLQRASAGGLGCGNCHNAGGAAAVLPFDGAAQVTLDLIKARAGVIDLATPATSLLLTKPLYEPAPVNHPNATFIDVNDGYYQLFLRWITQGAIL